MKFFVFLVFTLLLLVPPVFGQIAERTGLKHQFTVEADGRSFQMETVSNYDLVDFEFDGNEKRLTLFVNSGINNSLGEIQIPQNLIGGNFTFLLNDQEFLPRVQQNKKISFITLEFEGLGKHRIDIIGTSYLTGLTDSNPNKQEIENGTQGFFSDVVIIYLIPAAILGGIAVFVTLRKKKKTIPSKA